MCSCTRATSYSNARVRTTRLVLLLLLTCAPAFGCGGTDPADAPLGHSRTLGTLAASEFFFEKDGFPAATEPGAVTAAQATWLHGIDEVLGVVVNGHARAYPITMIGYHHVVNDVLAGTPVLVTY